MDSPSDRARQAAQDASGGRAEAETRARIAVEAARLISDAGIRDFAFDFAKRKAAAQLGLEGESSLPSNQEIEDALRTHQQLFHADEHDRLLAGMRETAVHAMRFLAEFNPRLIGAVLDGTADRHSAICLHLFCDDFDAPARFLDEHGIAYRSKSRILRTGGKHQDSFPALLFDAQDNRIDLTIFSENQIRLRPIDNVSRKPMQRATLKMVEGLLGSPSAHP